MLLFLLKPNAECLNLKCLFLPCLFDLKPNAEYLNLKYLLLPCLKFIPHRS